MAHDDAYLGRTIDERYVIHRLLGRGGMGAVYEARHLGLDRRVAVKFLLAGNTYPDELERFRREARAASRIDHENVVRIFDTGTDGGVSFIAMELVDGIELRKLLTLEGPLDRVRVIELGRQLLAGLDAIHDAGIVHRDIKPGNLVVTRIGEREVLKIMDFGISKTREPGLTAVGSAIGTPEFMAPEQRLGEDVDHRVDIYAAGLTLFMMLTGHLPGDAPTSAPDSPPHIPSDLSLVLDRALARNPERRFASAREFAAALGDPSQLATSAGTGDAPTVRDRPAAAPTRRTPASQQPSAVAASPRSRWLAGLGIVAVLAVVAFVVWELTRRDEPLERTGVTSPQATNDDADSERELAYARNAEAAGKLDLATSAYEEVQRRNETAPIAFKLGELHQRSGRSADAARHFERYLVLAPDATDRGAVRMRITSLHTLMDAGVAALVPDAPTRHATTGNACSCFREGFMLCPKKVAAPVCTCKNVTAMGFGVRLCTHALPACDKSDSATCDGTGRLRCTDAARVAGKTPDERCEGYRRESILEQGAYACNWCPGEQLRAYHGKPGSECSGFDAHSGKRVDGVLEDCWTTAPNDRTISR